MAEYIERTEELMLAMNAGARAIENTKRYHGAVYTGDVFSESPQEIPYLQAAKVLRETSDAPAADVAEVRHGKWVEYPRAHYFKCSECKYTVPYRKAIFVNGNREYDYCPSCGARMDKEDEHEVSE